MKKVFILGGTGFLGYYTAKELLGKGYQVVEISLLPIPAENLFPSEVTSLQGDLLTYTDEQILQLLEGVHAFIYAAGADERIIPEAPAAKFFYTANVLPTQRIARLAKQAGVKKFVLFNSYFSHWAEQWPELKLDREAGYPRTRLLQEEVAMLEGAGGMDVMSLRLPYIFGTMPGRVPLWSMFYSRVINQDTVYVPRGGTAMVTAQQVAEATVGAIEYGAHEGRYAISGGNIKFTDFYKYIAESLDQPNTNIIALPVEQLKPAMEEHDKQTHEAGREHGIHLATGAEIQDRDAFIDPADTQPVLQFKSANLIASIHETLKVCAEAVKNK